MPCNYHSVKVEPFKPERNGSHVREVLNVASETVKVSHGLLCFFHELPVGVETIVYERRVNVSDIISFLFETKTKDCVFISIAHTTFVEAYVHEHFGFDHYVER